MTSPAVSTYSLRACIWELTLRCDMNCLHCGSVAGAKRENELTLDECLRVADDLIGLGCKELTLIGGEIFFFRNWSVLARHLSSRGVLVNIMTNAYTIGEPQIRQIREAGLCNVGISIDGMEATHDRIRRNGSFARIRHALELLRRERIPAGVVTSIMELNFPELDELYTFLVENGVCVWQLQLVNAMGNMKGRHDLILRADRIPLLTDFAREKNQERRMTVIAADSIGYYDENEAYIRGRRGPICVWEGCQAGMTSVCIDSCGNVKGCGALYDPSFIEGNVRQRTLAEIWNDPECFGYNRRFQPGMLTGKCRSCDVADVCRGGCRASNHFAHGRLYESAYCGRGNTGSTVAVPADEPAAVAR